MDLAFILFLDICSRLPLTAGTTLDCATMASVKREDVCYVIITLGNKSLHELTQRFDSIVDVPRLHEQSVRSSTRMNSFSRPNAKFDVHVLLNTDTEKPLTFRLATSSSI